MLFFNTIISDGLSVRPVSPDQTPPASASPFDSKQGPPSYLREAQGCVNRHPQPQSPLLERPRLTETPGGSGVTRGVEVALGQPFCHHVCDAGDHEEERQGCADPPVDRDAVRFVICCVLEVDVSVANVSTKPSQSKSSTYPPAPPQVDA